MSSGRYAVGGTQWAALPNVLVMDLSCAAALEADSNRLLVDDDELSMRTGDGG